MVIKNSALITLIINILSILLLIPSVIYSLVKYRQNKDQFGIYKYLIFSLVCVIMYTAGFLINAINVIILEQVTILYRKIMMAVVMSLQFVFDALQHSAIMLFVSQLAQGYQISHIFLPFQQLSLKNPKCYWKIHFMLLLGVELISLCIFLVYYYLFTKTYTGTVLLILYWSNQCVFDLYVGLAPFIQTFQLKNSKYETNKLLFVTLMIINSFNLVIRIYDMVMCILWSSYTYQRDILKIPSEALKEFIQNGDEGWRILSLVFIIVKDIGLCGIVYLVSKIFKEYKEMQTLIKDYTN